VLLAVIGILIGRDNGLQMDSDQMGNGMGNSRSTNSNYTGADIMFLQMMIPHHQQAIDISDLAMKKSQDPELLALAQNIATAQAAEIVTMRAWLKDAGAGKDMGHSASGMGGMLSDSELAKLKTSAGKDFDFLWLQGMIGHHDGAIHMTAMITDAQNSEIKTFGLKIVADQSVQIQQMQAMLVRLK